MIAIVVLSLVYCASLTGLYFSVKKNLEFIEAQENMMDQLEESIELLQVCQKKIDKKLKLEIFSDEPAVKELVEDMKMARKAVLLITENLTGQKEDIDGYTAEETE